MTFLKKTILPILIAGIWINISEFVRNEVIVKSYWVEHYSQMNLVFPAAPLNGLVWAVWGFSFAILIFILSKKYNLLMTTILAWFASFFMMWTAIWNLNVLPISILWIAFPLSLIEAFLGALIAIKISGSSPD